MFSEDNGFGHARLGLIVSKKAAKRANRRNFMKRVIRDWFRQHKHDLPSRDDAKIARQQLTELMLPRK